MSDIIDRLRSWVYTDSLYATALEAADEIERLRSRPCPYVSGTVTRYCTLTPFALTDAEREAVAWALKEAVWSYSADTGNHRPTLRGLLERLGGDR